MNTYRAIIKEGHKRTRHLVFGSSINEAHQQAWREFGKSCVDSVVPIRIPRHAAQKARAA